MDNYVKQDSARQDIIDQFEKVSPYIADEMREAIRVGDSEWDMGEILFDGYVDHQSRHSYPVKYDSKVTSNLLKIMLSDNVVVLGGNDNSDGHPGIGVETQPIAFLNNMQETSPVKIREDGDNLVAFSPGNGNKMRFNMNAMADSVYEKSHAPELVDVKITGFCEKNCKFCYMSSTTSGLHGNFDNIVKIFDMLAEMQVFEVALGGGEPTSHPRFLDILKAARERDIVPNFTTFTRNWLDRADADEILQATGAIGVSCQSEKDLELVREIKTRAGYATKVMAQHVIGAVPIEVTTKFIEKAFEEWIPVLLLGYKEVGFGSEYHRFDDVETFESLLALIMNVNERNRHVNLSVDTALVDRYPNLTKILGAPEALVSSPEGKFSCYIDATTLRQAKSSYVLETEMTPLMLTTEDFLKEYAKY
jgi:hypothetical protein